MEKRKRLRGGKMKNRVYKRERKRIWNAKKLSLRKDRKQEKEKDKSKKTQATERKGGK